MTVGELATVLWSMRHSDKASEEDVRALLEEHILTCTVGTPLNLDVIAQLESNPGRPQERTQEPL